jgi:hypothetical protein
MGFALGYYSLGEESFSVKRKLTFVESLHMASGTCHDIHPQSNTARILITTQTLLILFCVIFFLKKGNNLST